MTINDSRTRHHAALASLHPSPEANGLSLWRKLRRIEARAHRAAEAACSDQAGADAWEAESDLAEEAVRKVFGGTLPRGFFVNGDPRGYALKIEGNLPDGLHKDWGGYGILAADLS